MAKVLMLVYAGVAVCFLRAYLGGLTVTGVIVSLLWPVSLALALAWLVILDDDASTVSERCRASGLPAGEEESGR